MSISGPGSSPILQPSAPPPAEAPLFSDGIGDRVVSSDPTTGELVQVLRINPALTAVPSFEFALRERVARLANFRHPYFARVRRVDRAPAQVTALALVSDHVEGTRLSEILRVAEERRLHLDVNAALCLIRQLVPALALLHENARDAAHGLVAAERLVVTPNGRLIVLEHVFGAAVEQMQYGRERLWHEFGVAMPPSAGIPRFDQRADVTGIGIVALSLVLGRMVRRDEFPRGLGDLLNNARERNAMGEDQPVSPQLRSWLARALQLDLRRAFGSAPEALAALDEVTAEGTGYVAAPVALETFLSSYISAVLVPTPLPAAAAVVPPPVAVTAAVVPVQGPEAASEEAAGDPAPLFNPDAPFALPEEEDAAPVRPAKKGRVKRGMVAAAASVVLLASGGFASYQFFASSSAPPMATLSVQSNPAGIPVFVDGVERGVTPAKLTLAPGAHILELRRGVPRVIPVTLSAGADVTQYLEFTESLPLDIPAAPPVPAAVPNEASAEAASTPAAPLAGWITVKLPFAAEIRQQGRLLGTTEADRLMLPSGAQELEFVNEPLGYRHVRRIQVAPGRVTSVALEIPKGVINLNAAPWAEVWVDGQRIGETPIGNLSLAIGAHEVVFRHPQFGEKRHAVSVTTGAPVRLSVDMK
jgi:hypothetical protein